LDKVNQLKSNSDVVATRRAIDHLTTITKELIDRTRKTSAPDGAAGGPVREEPTVEMADMSRSSSGSAQVIVEDAKPTPFKYDVFISYRRVEPDRGFARDLLKRLEADGFVTAIDERDFDAHESFLKEMERCTRESRFTLAIISSRYLESGNSEEEAILRKVRDMANRKRGLIPIGLN
jgi:hypothetical protein